MAVGSGSRKEKRQSQGMDGDAPERGDIKRGVEPGENKKNIPREPGRLR